MATIQFDYNDWNDKDDILLERPGSELGFGVVNAGLPIDKAPTVRQGERNPSIGPAIDGVIGLLAGSLEWLRWYGLNASDVQARVKAYKRRHTDSAVQKKLLDEYRAITEISDRQNVKHRLSDEAKQTVGIR